jgi:phage portal protein BeeE
MPWAIKWEMESRRKLFTADTRKTMYTKFDFRGLLRGDHAARKEYYSALLDRGVFDIDEVRGFEDMNPLEDGKGKVRVIPANMTTLERAIAGDPAPNTNGQVK